MKKFLLFITITLAGMFLMVPVASAAEQAPDCDIKTVTASHNSLTEYVVSTSGDNCTIYLATYLVADTWDGKGYNPTAFPQELFSSKAYVVTNEPQTFTADVPDCGAVQTDVFTHLPPQTLQYDQLDGIKHGTIGMTPGGECQPPPPEVKKTQASVDFFEATCKNPEVSFSTEYNKQEVTAAVVGDASPGEKITVTFTAKEGYKLTTQSVWSHTFNDVPTNCGHKPHHPDHPDHPNKPDKPDTPNEPELPHTGSDVLPLSSLLGTVMVGLGGAVLGIRRKWLTH